jgi:hypothetical protein
MSCVYTGCATQPRAILMPEAEAVTRGRSSCGGSLLATQEPKDWLYLHNYNIVAESESLEPEPERIAAPAQALYTTPTGTYCKVYDCTTSIW